MVSRSRRAGFLISPFKKSALRPRKMPTHTRNVRIHYHSYCRVARTMFLALTALISFFALSTFLGHGTGTPRSTAVSSIRPSRGSSHSRVLEAVAKPPRQPEPVEDLNWRGKCSYGASREQVSSGAGVCGHGKQRPWQLPCTFEPLLAYRVELWEEWDTCSQAKMASPVKP